MPDLFHVHEPDLLGPVIARAGSRPVIYDVHESYLDMLNENMWLPHWAKPFARMAWDRWERRLVRRCAGIVVATEPLSLRYSRLRDKVCVVANYPSFESVDNLPPVKRDGATCVFAGVLRPDRGISQMFEALALLKRRGLTVRLALAGLALSDEYLASLLNEAKVLGIDENVQYHGILSRAEAMKLQHRASISLIADLPCRSFMVALPTKLVECMALGLPVVCSDFPVYREVAGATGAGITVDPTKPEQIADAIESLVRDPARARRMGEAGREAVRTRFNWQAESTKLLDLYHQLVGAPTRHGRVDRVGRA
jgi:glycosyltransferase involved in cell wall biosynthesis